MKKNKFQNLVIAMRKTDRYLMPFSVTEPENKMLYFLSDLTQLMTTIKVNKQTSETLNIVIDRLKNLYSKNIISKNNSSYKNLIFSYKNLKEFTAFVDKIVSIMKEMNSDDGKELLKFILHFCNNYHLPFLKSAYLFFAESAISIIQQTAFINFMEMINNNADLDKIGINDFCLGVQVHFPTISSNLNDCQLYLRDAYKIFQHLDRFKYVYGNLLDVIIEQLKEGKEKVTGYEDCLGQFERIKIKINELTECHIMEMSKIVEQILLSYIATYHPDKGYDEILRIVLDYYRGVISDISKTGFHKKMQIAKKNYILETVTE